MPLKDFATIYCENVARCLLKGIAMAVKLVRRDVDVLISVSLSPPHLPSNPSPGGLLFPMAIHAAQLTVPQTSLLYSQ
jgi:hypothetical protein